MHVLHAFGWLNTMFIGSTHQLFFSAEIAFGLLLTCFLVSKRFRPYFLQINLITTQMSSRVFALIVGIDIPYQVS
jgi:hypothetical protein